MTTPRQTQSYLRNLFESRGLKPKGKLGQNFLIDLNLLQVIVAAAELGREDLVLEVGSGTGSLTAALAAQAGAVLGVELDPDFYQLARENTAAFSNVVLLHVDILESKHRINRQVLDTLRRMLVEGPARRLKLVANLPYVVATPVITNFLVSDLPFERMVVTIQWELAARLVAEPSTKDYGSLSVLVQSLADPRILRRLPPQVFWPRPKVDSALVLIRPNPAKRAAIRDLPGFQSFVRDLYLHRRKNLRGALHPLLGKRFDKESLDALLSSHGFDPGGRAEALTVAEHLRLFEVLFEAGALAARTTDPNEKQPLDPPS
ncbi:MAG: 16S rRNA (adenine(1518)-N(6)/adenine(1519)-N(6))-dimethyltransferase RsmA [Gemmatales bacterium]|nr:16S rRNA (adenine(1518)-N(6)/adenine(1519)-N(6))-dimethyltransferase RsmA [Gemmatales bacterium]MDW8386945.1 16S rRNA (adenine(1518)-N(6)/adenine(1519)-N(6))-dimethyltransferase RsmA [Gemmatales bacterium]